jgi:hypothetical protein
MISTPRSVCSLESSSIPLAPPAAAASPAAAAAADAAVAVLLMLSEVSMLQSAAGSSTHTSMLLFVAASLPPPLRLLPLWGLLHSKVFSCARQNQRQARKHIHERTVQYRTVQRPMQHTPADPHPATKQYNKNASWTCTSNLLGWC